MLKKSVHDFRKLLSLSTAALSITFVASEARGAPAVGQPAPAFSAQDSHGKTHRLQDFRGQYVVLEWLNHGCPYVRKHYDSNNMQALQRRYTEKGVVWLSVISSAPNKQGFSTPTKANKDIKTNKAAPTAVLLDVNGSVGKIYGAQTTPHMYVINPQGLLVYAGAIDSIRSTSQKDIGPAQNYVSAALDESMAGKSVTVSSTKAYGCSVKYN